MNKIRPRWLWLLMGQFLLLSGTMAAPELIEARKIWDRAPHNAFTDLARVKDQWLCVFREGKAHVSADGAIRVLKSESGADWESAALLTDERGDLRDPKMTVTPDGQLMLTAALAIRKEGATKHQTLVWFSKDEKSWGKPEPIGEENVWLWRVSWHKGKAYGAGYDTAKEKFVRLYTSADGRRFEKLVERLFDEGSPNETALVFAPDDRCFCLLRRDGKPNSGQLGVAQPPYREWKWKDLGKQIGGPQAVRLPDGRFIAGVRLYDGKVRTSLAWLDVEGGTLTECLPLPSGGDSSYPGMVWHDGLLWVSYYSSHEGKTSIYLAKVKLPAAK